MIHNKKLIYKQQYLSYQIICIYIYLQRMIYMYIYIYIVYLQCIIAYYYFIYPLSIFEMLLVALLLPRVSHKSLLEYIIRLLPLPIKAYIF